MIDLINKIKELYADILKRDANSVAKSIHLASELTKVENKASEQKSKDIELSNRQAEISKKESLLSANDTVISLNTEIVRLREDMAAEKKSHLEWVAKQKAEIEKSYKDITASLIEVKRREDAAEEKSKKLDEDRKTYKQEIIKEMDKAR